MDRHARVVEQAAGHHHHLGVPRAHAVLGDHRRLDPGTAEETQQPQRDIGHDLHVHPGVVRHA
jgi:hypothetical protein